MMDLALLFSNEQFDISQSGNDLATEQGLRSVVITSLYTDRRANPDDVIPDGTNDRRGYWGDTFAGYQLGSRLWLLSREKEVADVLVRAREYTEEALQWLVDKGIAKSLEVTAWHVRSGLYAVKPVITLENGSTYTDVFQTKV